ncbi:MAG: hypothetical protein A3F76_07290 [Burkholderiales bacterium RIFCSPLOWO2_12_FULL_65_40]|nr:MAG: hypothetical protein A3F76_07290 [Burkholderiales bacterium RIFCSPLOWO2_12_FULL_65_40]
MLLSNLDLLATAPGGVARLRELILTLAVQGKLVPQDPADEPAGVLLQKIRAEKDRLIAEGKIKRDKPLAEIGEEEKPFGLPVGWEWVRLGAVVNASEAGWSPTCIGSPRRPGHWGVLKVSAVSWGSFDPTANKELPSELTPKPEYEVKDGDFLLSRANTAELVARSVVVGVAEPQLMLSDKIIRLSVSSQMNRAFLNMVNNANYSREHYAANASGTSSSMKNVSREVVLALPVPLPPLAEQSRIVTRVEALMRLCDALEAKGQLEAAQHAQLVSTLLGTLTASTTPEELAANWQRVAQHFDLLLDRLEAIDALEQTLLQLAVRGLLVPQDPQDEPASQLLVRLRRDRATWLATRASTDSECRATIKKLRDLPDADNPFSIPSGWQFVRLLDCCRLLVDCHNKTAPYAAAGIPIIRTSNIRDGRFRMDDLRYVTEETYDFWSRRCPPEPGDIMFTREAPMGEAAIIPPGAKYCLGQRTMLVRPMHEFIDKEYLLLALTEPHLLERAAPSAIGSTVKHLRVGDVEGLTIPLPPLAEQSRIVTRVTALRRLCADLRQRLAERQSVQARLAQALVASVA